MAVLLTTAISSANGVPTVTPAAVTLTFSPRVPGTTGTTDVSISALGQMFAAASTFQGQLAAIQPGAAASGTGTNFGADLPSLAAEAQNFVDAFNQAQAGIAGLQGLTQASQFAASLSDLARSTFANGASGANSLAQIGINLQSAATAGTTPALGIDMNALRLAFEADPNGTFSLLTEAVRSFGNLAAQAQTGQDRTDATNAMLSQILALQASLSLFGGGDLSTPLGLASLLGVQAGADNPGQQIAALRQFALVSSLLS